MKTNLTKREFLQSSSVGGVAAVMGLLTGRVAEAKEVSSVDDILAELAESITAISYIEGLAFVVAAIFKFKQQKDNPTQGSHNPLGLISAVWALIDDSTVTSLTELNYSPQFLVDAVEQAKDGDTSDLLGFFNDVNLLA
jgi:hypothetical protein